MYVVITMRKTIYLLTWFSPRIFCVSEQGHLSQFESQESSALIVAIIKEQMSQQKCCHEHTRHYNLINPLCTVHSLYLFCLSRDLFLS